MVAKTQKKVENVENAAAEVAQQGGKKAAKKAASKTAKKAAPKKAASKSAKKPAAKKAGKKGQKGGEGATERYFKLFDAKSGKTLGRYTGDTPKQAASKGYTKLLQKLKESGKAAPKETTIYMRESTRGSARKVYGYTANRKKLAEPQQVTIKDKVSGEEKTVTYNYRNNIKKIAVPEEMQTGGKKKAAKKAAKKAGSKSAKKAGSKKAAPKKAASKSAKKPAKGAKKPAKKAAKKH